MFTTKWSNIPKSIKSHLFVCHLIMFTIVHQLSLRSLDNYPEQLTSTNVRQHWLDYEYPKVRLNYRELLYLSMTCYRRRFSCRQIILITFLILYQ